MLPPGSLPVRRACFWSWCWALLVGLSALLAPMGGVGAEPAQALEYKVKAGYLFNFAKFVEWPSAALPAPDSPFVIGVLDGDEALPVLRSVLEGKQVNGHPLKVKAVSADNEGKDVHIFFVTRAAGKSPQDLRKALGAAPTLLVGETAQFAEGGGMVGFVYQEESIRLALNLEQTTQAGLKVSARLSNVAKVVKTKPSK
jgi:hypothetical protein